MTKKLVRSNYEYLEDVAMLMLQNELDDNNYS